MLILSSISRAVIICFPLYCQSHHFLISYFPVSVHTHFFLALFLLILPIPGEIRVFEEGRREKSDSLAIYIMRP